MTMTIVAEANDSSVKSTSDESEALDGCSGSRWRLTCATQQSTMQSHELGDVSPCDEDGPPCVLDAD